MKLGYLLGKLEKGEKTYNRIAHPAEGSTNIHPILTIRNEWGHEKEKYPSK